MSFKKYLSQKILIEEINIKNDIIKIVDEMTDYSNLLDNQKQYSASRKIADWSKQLLKLSKKLITHQ